MITWLIFSKNYYGLLLTHSNFKLDEEIKKRLEKEGINIIVKNLDEPINYERLKLFNFVILICEGDFATSTVPVFFPREFVLKFFNCKTNLQEICKYVEKGGGLFFIPNVSGSGTETTEAYNEFLNIFGIRALPLQVRDEKNSACNGEYSYTTNIKKHPVTTGVNKIFYPTNMMRWDDAYSTICYEIIDKEWIPIIKGMPESYSAKGLQYKIWFAKGKEPIICAIRNYKSGKVAVIGISHYYILSYPFSKPSKGWIGENNTGNIDGIFIEKGDGKENSNGWKLILNILKYLSEDSIKKGFGGYSEEEFLKIPSPESAKIPEWLTWNEKVTKPFKVLIGIRSSYSNGKGGIKEFAEKAKKFGYSVIIMTEKFEYFNPDKWGNFINDCEKASNEEIIVLPGIDIEDIYQNRYIVFGQKTFPEQFMLDETGKKIKQTQYLMLGFGTHFSAIHRPTTTPIPHQLYKFFSGIVVYTYEKDKLVDNGLLAYEWHVNNTSMPIPLVVHEIYSPDEIELATKGHQLYIFSDSPKNASWYIKGGIQHFWEEPVLFLVSSGPIIKTLSHSKLVIDAEFPIKEIQLRARYYPERIWKPNEKRVEIDYYLPPTHFRIGYFYIMDEKGNNAISPCLRFGPTIRYTWRCSDRQNFFGWVWHYTGTRVPDIDIRINTFGTDEGKGIWINKRGENLCPLLEFPFASRHVYITEASIENRYWNALWEDVAFDAKSSHGTSTTRVYNARIRYYDFNITPNGLKDEKRPMILKEIWIKLKIPIFIYNDEFPVFTKVSSNPEYLYYDKELKKWMKGKLVDGYMDFKEGSCIDDLITFTPVRVNFKGEVGFLINDKTGIIPSGKEFYAKYIKLEKDLNKDEILNFLGFGEKEISLLKLEKGKLEKIEFPVIVESENFGISGEIIEDRNFPFEMPIFIKNLNPNWETGLWKETGEIEDFGVFERNGIVKINFKKGGKFYAGNLIISDNLHVKLTIIKWDKKGIVIEINNPTDKEI
ncbi:MAG: hypothetical protein QW754_05925, partial [Thermoplasmata archaeon]